MKFSVSARPPFHFISVVHSHGWRQLAPFSYDEITNTLSYILRLANRCVVELKLREGVEDAILDVDGGATRTLSIEK